MQPVRLIDANALLQKIEHHKEIAMQNGDYKEAVIMDRFASAVAEQPTILITLTQDTGDYEE